MGTINVLSLSYGKDFLACLGACEKLGWKIDRIIHAEVWATDEISADLPPMLEFKKKADAIIKERYGLEVEHICAMTTPNRKYGSFTKPLMGGGGQRVPTKSCSITEQQEESISDKSMDSHAPQKDGVIGSNYKVKLTYQDIFYRPMKSRERERERRSESTDTQSSKDNGATPNSNNLHYGFANIGCPYCTSELKANALRIPKHRSKMVSRTQASTTEFSDTPQQQGAETNTVVQFLGIAADEPERIERHGKKPNIKLPLVEMGWTEADCRKWCEENDLLSPIYTTATRGGCWFCHNQGIEQMRLLRKNYPQLWELLLKWDLDSPVTFKADGHTVHDYDERFALEDQNKVPKDRTFRWWMIEDAKTNDQISFEDLER